jgi:hypothetical protein
LSIAVPCALFALGSMLLADMPWFVLPLLWLVPLAIGVARLAGLANMTRASVLVAVSLLVALVPIAAASYAVRMSVT